MAPFTYARGLTWSPDGTKLALVIPGPDGQGGLYVANADGTGLQFLAGDAAWGTPAWRPVP